MVALRKDYYRFSYAMPQLIKRGSFLAGLFIALAGSSLAQSLRVQEARGKPIQTADIHVRDPFIYADSATRTYYLYAQMAHTLGSQGRGKGVEAYTSKDLQNWQGPFPVFHTPADFWGRQDVWAPEVHAYRGKYYLFVTFTSADTLPSPWPADIGLKLHQRGTQVLVADGPMGPFRLFANRPHTPPHWAALDGTLYVEDNEPWLVFCHEWLQTKDGTMDALRLRQDLSAPEGDPVTLFKATDASWVKGIPAVAGKAPLGYVTDGPFPYRTRDGKLLMIWSSFGEQQYAIGLAESASGRLGGPWKQLPEPLFRTNGGHGMIFRTFDRRLLLVLHQPNTSPRERMQFFELVEEQGGLALRQTR